jgi:hypothetical protein
MIGGRRTFKRIVLLNEIMFCTTLPGEILTSSPTHIPVRVHQQRIPIIQNLGLTSEEGDNGLVHGSDTADLEVVRDPEGEDQEKEDLQEDVSFSSPN